MFPRDFSIISSLFRCGHTGSHLKGSLSVSIIRHFVVGADMEKRPHGEKPQTSFQGEQWRRGPNKKDSLKHIVYKKRVGKLPVPSLIDLQVIGNGTAGNPKSMFVHLNYFRYLINCGEGTQRCMTEHKMKLSRIANIFITHNNWENIGGLMGMLLSMNDVNVPEIKLHGPPNVEKLVTMSRSFATFQNIKIDKKEVSEGSYEDSAMSIQYVPLYPDSTDEESDSCEGSPDLKKRRICKESDMSVVYICKPHVKPGTLSLEKCVDLGVPRGPIFGRLKNGEEVTLEDGRVIKPEDVVSPTEPCYPFIVMECPTEAYLQSLLDNEELKKFLDSKSKEDRVDIIIHFTPSSVMKTSKYQEWMNRFGPETKHMVLNGTGGEVSLESVYKIQAKLNLLHPEVFPLLPHQRDIPQKVPVVDGPTVAEGHVIGETGVVYTLRGGRNSQRGYSREKCVVLDNESFVKQAYEEDGFREAHEMTKNSLKSHIFQESENAERSYPEVVFLGTGSASPNKVRNVSCIALHLTDSQCMLLDCGESAYGQLYRYYGNGTEEVLRKLVGVFISHLHADHHMGLAGVLLARKKAFLAQGIEAPPLTVFAPETMQKWINSMDNHVFPITKLLRLVPLEWLRYPGRQDHGAEYEETLNLLGMSEFQPVWVNHRQFPHGIVMKHQSGWKLVYSGDTTPSDFLVKTGQNCDILIHEATMEDDLEEEARQKRHCTTSQAIDVGIRMNAKFILLTHFSQRYAKVPIFNNNFSNRVGIAFDNMRVCHRDVSLLPLFMPALKAMFAEDYAEMEERTEKRSISKARLKAEENSLNQIDENSTIAKLGSEKNEPEKDKLEVSSS